MESQTRYRQWNACYLILFSSMEAWSGARFKIYLLPKLGPFLRNALTFSNLRNKSGSYCRSGKIAELYLLLNASIHNTNLWIVDQLLFDIFLNPVLLSYFWKKNLYNCILKRTRRFIFSTLSLYLYISDKEIIFGIENWQLMEGRCKFDDCYTFSKSTVKL